MNWLALSRDGNAGRPADDAAGLGVAVLRVARRRPPLPKLNAWAFHAVSVKPRTYDQSCIRLCIAWRFARAASMSFCWSEVNDAGLQRDVNHWFVHG